MTTEVCHTHLSAALFVDVVVAVVVGCTFRRYVRVFSTRRPLKISHKYRLAFGCTIITPRVGAILILIPPAILMRIPPGLRQLQRRLPPQAGLGGVGARLEEGADVRRVQWAAPLFSLLCICFRPQNRCPVVVVVVVVVRLSFKSLDYAIGDE